ncbi:MAG: TonB family protein [Candidatus Binatia bacterium]
MSSHVDVGGSMIVQATLAPTAGRSPAPATYRFGCAGVVSLALHAAVGLLVMSLAVRVPQLAPPIRVLLYQPAPAPPPPAAAVAAPVQPALVPQPLPEPHKAVVRTAKSAPKPVPHVRARPAPDVMAPVPAPVPDVAPSQRDIVQSRPDGVPGGVAGGIPGGILGGTGHALPSADQVPFQPVAISAVRPEYPPLARLRGIEGQVVLEAILTADGHVEPDITVVQSIPPLDTAAIAAVRQWRFRPARDRNGVPVRVTLRVPVRFVLR